ncbi:MAG: carbon-nitrogen hydrolase family protein [Dehalococcoidia bacterium]|nr:carbon-nitrogen hydrolase family protein [Dehalococcoidia bacterium]
MAQIITVAAAQIEPRILEKESNLAKIKDCARKAAAMGAELIVFPEAALSGYCFDNLDQCLPVAEPIPGPSTNELAKLCKELNVYLVVGMLEQASNGIYNSASLIGPDAVLANYRKTHLPYLGIDRFVSHGKGPITPHKTPIGSVGMHICYDATFPEVARTMSLLGADILTLPTNWPEGRERMPGFVIHARALENHVFFIACDRVGEERGFRFIGRSKILSYTGDTLAEASADKEEIIIAKLDLDEARNKHVVYRPREFESELFGDRRPELYGVLSRDDAMAGLRNNRGDKR